MPRARRPPEKRYDKKVAVVTGASSGIGRRLAVDLAARGATVVGVARREALLAELEADLQRRSGAGATRVCDLADPAAFVELLGKVEEEHGRIDVLVNDAGTEALTPALPYTLSSSGTPEKQGSTATRLSGGVPTEYRYVLEVNFFAAVAGTLAVLPGMAARRSGIVVNVSSDVARAPEPRHGAYGASKAALSAFSESVAHEVASHGVSVHLLYPGWVPTAMGTSGTDDGGTPPSRFVRRSEERVSALTLERMGGPRMEINAAALPLLAPLARSFAPIAYQRAMRRLASTPG